MALSGVYNGSISHSSHQNPFRPDDNNSAIFTPWWGEDVHTSGFLHVSTPPAVVANRLVATLCKWVQENHVDFEVKGNTIVGRFFDSKFTNMASFHISIHSVPQDGKCVVYIRRQGDSDFFLYSRVEAKLVAFLQNLPQVAHENDESLTQLQPDNIDTWKCDEEDGEDQDESGENTKFWYPSLLLPCPEEENSDSACVKQLLEEACDVTASPRSIHNTLDDLLTLLDNRREYFQKSLPCDAELVVQELLGVALQSLDVQQVRGLVQMVLAMVEQRIVSTMQEETREKVQESLKKLQEMWLQGRERRFGGQDEFSYTLRVSPSQQIAAICEKCLTSV
jgi:hypothetical protein